MAQRTQASTPPPPTSPISPYEDESMDCPLCMEEMDPTDRHFKPCPCGYQVCRFCWNRIRQNENERCPACRRIYTDEAVEFMPLTIEELVALKQRSKPPSSKPDYHSAPASTTRKEFLDEEEGPVLPSRRHLIDVRVTQKNLVYVIGIPINLADEHVLKRDEYFGRFGKIVKLVINKRAYVRTTGSGPISNAAAYITFSKDEEALKAIRQIDGKMIEGAKLLRATYGTTKYCAHFLRGRHCPKNGCLYLHHEVVTTSDDDPARLESTPASPPASPTPVNMATALPSIYSEFLESDRTRSFFDRLVRWSKMDDLLADLSPENETVRFKCSSSDKSTFNPFDDPPEDFESIKATEKCEGNVARQESINETSSAGGEAKVHEACKGSESSSISSLPPGIILSSAGPECIPGDHGKQDIGKKLTSSPKVFTTAQLSAKNKSEGFDEGSKISNESITSFTTNASSTIASSSSTLLTRSSSTSNAAIPRKSVQFSNDNLFSVLGMYDDDLSENYGHEDEKDEKTALNVAVEQSKKSSAKEKKSNKKQQSKKKSIDDDLNELLRQVELGGDEKGRTKGKKSLSVSTPITDASTKSHHSTTQNTATQQKRQHRAISLKMEEESSHRVRELEQALHSSRIDAKEIEGCLRESIITFLQSMNAQLDDEYIPSADD